MNLLKIILKNILRLLAVIVVLILIVIFVSTRKVDRSPYFNSDYYKASISNMDKAIADSKTHNGSLSAGMAKINITPTIKDGDASKGEFAKIKMSGFGDGQHAVGAHDSLYVKAVALKINDKIQVIIGADLLMIPENLVEKIMEKVSSQSDLKREQIMFGATHTHSSIGNCIPGFIGKSFAGDYQPEVVNWLSQKYTEVILAAIADIKPAQIGFVSKALPQLVRNRIIGETGRLNNKFNLLAIKQDSAKTAAIGIFAAHATTISTSNNEFSADYPGYFQNKLEDLGVDQAMFFAGTVGSHSYRADGKAFEKAKFMGESLAVEADSLLQNVHYQSQVEVQTIQSEIVLPDLQMMRLSDDVSLASWAGQKLIPPVKHVYLQGLKLNQLVWLTLPYEWSGEYAVDLKNAMAQQNFNSVFTSFNGQYLGYITPAKYYNFETYEARLMGWYGPSMGDYLLELNFKMANALTKQRL